MQHLKYSHSVSFRAPRINIFHSILHSQMTTCLSSCPTLCPSPNTLNIWELPFDPRKQIYSSPISRIFKPSTQSTSLSLFITDVVRSTATVVSSTPVRLNWACITLIIVCTCEFARVRIDVIKHETLQLLILSRADLHWYIEDSPVDTLKAWRLGGGSRVSPEVEDVARFEWIPNPVHCCLLCEYIQGTCQA